MTRKDYELIASVIRQEREEAIGNVEEHGTVAITELGRSMADRLQRTYPNFKRGVFLLACGIEEVS